MQVNRMALEFALLDVQQNLSSIDNINNGGCGFVAYYLYSKLKSFGFNCHIVVAESHNFHSEITEPVEQDINSFVFLQHLFVEVEYSNGCFALIDAKHIYDGNRYTYNNVNNKHATPESLFVTLDNTSFWNPAFNRSNVPTIIESIDSISFN